MLRMVFDLSVGDIARISSFNPQMNTNIFESRGISIGQTIEVLYKSAVIVILINSRMLSISKMISRDIYVSM